MTQASNNFEKQIERIHSLLEDEDSIVTWNDHLPDPDNPSQPRQIDVSIRRNNALTLVECRIHAEPQGVQWIEELIGRRSSLKADAVIAVSASGFTRGAILKAKAYGIVLRDIKSLSEEEIRAWGGRTKIFVDLHHFDDIAMRFIFSKADANQVSLEDVEEEIRTGKNGLVALFDGLVERLRESDPDFPPIKIEARTTSSRLLVSGKQVIGIDIRAKCWREEKELAVPAVIAYDSPETGSLERNAYVEVVEQGKFEITQSSNIVSVAMDISTISRPAGTKLGRIHFNFTRPVEMHQVILLGDIDLGFWIGPFELGIDFE